MLWLFIGLLGGFAFVYLTRLYWADAQNTAPDRANDVTTAARRGPLATAAIAVLVLALVMLVTTGKVHWLSAAITGVIPFARRVTGLLRFAPLLPTGLFGKLRSAMEQASANASQERTSDKRAANSPEVSISEARLILDVGDHASTEEIVAAHRRLIARNHPDKGGSTYIAAQLNTAKDLLLNAQKS